MMERGELKGKVAVVTGGGGIIGSAIAAGLAREGAAVVILNRTQEKSETTARRIVDEGGTALALTLDVLDRAAAERAAAWIRDRLGSVDILVNGAGGNHPEATVSETQSFFDLPTAAIRRVTELNFLGTVIPTQVFGRIMAEQKTGSIINIASMASYHPLTNTPAYCAAKSAVANFTEWAAAYFCRNVSERVRVNAIAPGFLLTEQNRYLLVGSDGEDTPRGRAIKETTPMGRYGRPDEMVGAVLYLCSDAASFVTGAVIPVDGGFRAYWGA